MGEVAERGRQEVRKQETNGGEELRDKCFENWSIQNCFYPIQTLDFYANTDINKTKMWIIMCQLLFTYTVYGIYTVYT